MDSGSAHGSTPTFAIALGAGGSRGLAHISVLEAFDELGVKPVAVAGTSMGAIVGAAYAAGMRATELRAYALHYLKDRSTVMSALIESRVGRFRDVVSRLGNPFLIDGERFLDRFWPEAVPATFEDLKLPFQAVATDYFGRNEAVFGHGPLIPAVAGSMAIPGLIRPARYGDRLLVDGGAVNPLPFDHLIGRASVIVAVDVTGGPSPNPARSPAGFDAMFGTLQIMQGSIVAAKLKIYRPEIVVRPPVDRFRVLDFFEARAILAAADAIKDDLKREIARHFEDGPQRPAVEPITALPPETDMAALVPNLGRDGRFLVRRRETTSVRVVSRRRAPASDPSASASSAAEHAPSGEAEAPRQRRSAKKLLRRAAASLSRKPP